MAKATIEATVRIIRSGVRAMGPGKADLLAQIDATGSISAAARAMGMSYRRAWILVDEMNHCFRSPLVETVMGGAGGGGARLTELGHDVLAEYRRLRENVAEVIDKGSARILSYLG
jgi:molybdate transport system regulatory protein